MSSLNKAFLKAYQKSGVKRAPPAAAPAPTTSQAVVGAQLPPAPHFAAQPTVTEAATVAAAKSHIAVSSPSLAASPTLVIDTSMPASSDTGSSAMAPTQPPTPFAIVEMAHTALKAPHAKFVGPPAVKPAAPPTSTTPIPAVAKPPVIEPPLLTRPPAPILHTSSPASTIWQPVFELSNFSWPEITEAILAAAPGQFQTAATDLAEACRRHRKLVAVTGVHGGEGCSVIAMALARALASQQQKVVLVDAHFAAPRLANCLGVAAEVGWEESLAGERPLAEAVVNSIADHVALLPLKQPTPADWRLVETRLKSCFDELRRHFDVVLIDAGPLGEPTDKRQLLAWAAPCRVDRALVVLDGRSAIEEAMAEVDTRLQGCGIAQWSFVDNFAAA